MLFITRWGLKRKIRLYKEGLAEMMQEYTKTSCKTPELAAEQKRQNNAINYQGAVIHYLEQLLNGDA